MAVLNNKFNIPTTLELIKILVNMKAWKSKTPFQKWSYLYGVGRSFCNLIKMTTFIEDQTLCWISYYPLVFVPVHLILVIYTIVYYISNGEPSKCLPCTVVFVGPVCGVNLGIK